jgi:hypothetical protein
MSLRAGWRSQPERAGDVGVPARRCDESARRPAVGDGLVEDRADPQLLSTGSRRRPASWSPSRPWPGAASQRVEHGAAIDLAPGSRRLSTVAITPR